MVVTVGQLVASNRNARTGSKTTPPSDSPQKVVAQVPMRSESRLPATYPAAAAMHEARISRSPSSDEPPAREPEPRVDQDCLGAEPPPPARPTALDSGAEQA